MSERDDDRAGGQPDEEMRVGDILRAPEPAVVDPALVASLREWFDGPALGMDALLGQSPAAEAGLEAVAEDDSLESDGGEEEPEASQAPPRRLTMTEDEVDGELLERVFSRQDMGDAMLFWRGAPPPEIRVEAQINKLVEPPPEATEIRDAEPPWYMDQVLSECTPQSLLRDLARIEMDVDLIQMDYTELPTRGMGAFRERQSEVMSASYKQLQQARPCGGALLDDSLEEIRAIMDAKWDEIRPPKRRELSMAEYFEIEAKTLRGEL